MSKRDHGRKIREEQEAAAHVFQEFIQTFHETPTASKTFVKSGVLYADKNQLTPSQNKLYTPKPLIKSTAAVQSALECAKLLKDFKIEKPKKSKEKPKSNLELLKEELKQRHAEKDERDRLKEEIFMSGPALSYFDGGDPNSTNLFIASLNANVTEADLLDDFGVYGPLASVKIMWPRGEDKINSPSTNFGFVAYMSRKDAERALHHMRHRKDMRVGWGKSVEIPTHPIYIPQDLLRMFLPPPQSGLPFNAQTAEITNGVSDVDDTLFKAVVKVTIPLNKRVLALVHRMVEFVIKEGPMFEAMIMNNELGNPDFNFLFENKSPTHVYYRWKLFSVLQGEATKEWSMKPFRMFRGGSVWMPPTSMNYQAGMPDALIKDKVDCTSLSENQCERLIELIQNLTLSRNSIAEAMVFCLNHIPALNDSLEIVVDSLCNPATKPPSKIARFYLLSDILSNCSTKNLNVTVAQVKIETILQELHSCFKNISEDRDQSLFSSKVLRVIRQLDSIDFLSTELVKQFEDCFIISKNSTCENVEDGCSSSDEPLDGASLLKHALKNTSNNDCIITPTSLKAKRETKIKQEFFVPSKWDALDPEEIESQSMSSTKLYYMELDEKQNRDIGTKRERSRTPEYSPPRSKSKGRKRRSDKDSSPERYSRKHKEKRKKSSRR